jgi:hypothetical protein
MFRKLLSSLAVLCLVMSLAACSKNADQSQATSSTDNQSQAQQPSAANEQPTQSPSEPAVPPATTTSATETTAKPSAGTAKKAAPTRAASETPRAATTTKTSVAAPIVVPSGTVLTVRLDSAVGSKSSNAGDRFTASVADPVEVDGKVVIPRGAEASGTVHEAVPAGRLKGGSKLRISLDRLTIGGKQYPLQSSAVEQAGTGRGKRTAVMGGGGAAVGALIGGLTGGGKGAAIGALVGGGAGTAGAAYTGKRDIELPAETALSFKLTAPVEVR